MGRKATQGERRKWKRLIEKQSQSGQSTTKWCRNERVPYIAFCYWRKILAKETPIKSPFVLLEDPPPKAPITVEYKEIRLLLEENFDEGTFIRCLEVLRRLSC